MEADVLDTKPHHGFNVMVIRKKKHISQDALGEKLGMFQGQVSVLESQETIDDATLEKIAEALECPVSSLKNFDLDYAMNTFNSTISDTKDNSFINSGYSAEIHQTYNCNSPELIELYKVTLAAEKEARAKDAEVNQKEISAKDTEIEYLRKQLEELLKK